MTEIMPWACRRGLHTWAKWEDIGKGKVTFETGFSQPALIQEARCTRCNAAKRRTVYID